jgi:transposase
VLNLSFVRAQVAHTYGRRGNKSVPPEVIMRMMLLLFLEDIKSERELMRIIPERLDYLWFLSYGLDDEVPDHSVLSKARKRWGKEIFLALFSRVVQQCVEAGLVGGDKIHVDASLVDANGFFANLNHPRREKLSYQFALKIAPFGQHAVKTRPLLIVVRLLFASEEIKVDCNDAPRYGRNR